ncbi:MAG: HelD family protein, partial [Propionibacteriaceae bacterium]
MGSTQRELATEQAHVDQVYRRLEQAAHAARRIATEGRAMYHSNRETYLREEDGTSIFERDVFAFQAAKRLATLDAEHEGLVFGRLDHADGEIRYIGRIGVRDEEYEPLVIDWRARAAEPFYRATPAEPMNVVRRRVLRCRGDKVIDISDDLLDGESAGDEMVVVGDGALMAALSRARGHTMRDIVATIQGEQDQAIRAPHAGFTLISGGPGTGKTVVALHRAAYLLYSNRRRFENGGVLVVGPSQVFMHYIEWVLPSLGEDAVTLRSIGGVAADVVPVRGDRNDAPAAAAVKGSLRMVRVLRRLVSEPLGGQNLDLRVVVKGEALILRAEALARIRSGVLRQHKVNQGRAAAESALLGALWARWTEIQPDQREGTSNEPRGELDRDEFDDLVTSTAAWRMFGNAWWPTLTATTLLRRLSDPVVTARVADRVLETDEQRALSDSFARPDRAPDWSAADGALLDELVEIIGPEPRDEEVDPTLFLADGADVNEVVTTMDRLAPQADTDPFSEQYDTFAHVLVDEAQDITPMQWRMLRRRGANASWTVVGDPAQSSWPDAAEAQKAIENLIGTAPVRSFRMSTNYRSPAEVFNLAAQVVTQAFPLADLPTAVRSTGVKPLLLTAGEGDVLSQVRRQVARLADQVEGTIGIIAPESLLAEVAAAIADAGERGHPTAGAVDLSHATAGAVDLSHATGGAVDLSHATAGAVDLSRARPRLVVVSPLQSKGLEYDAVLAISPDRIVAEGPGGVR